ncbi:GNAT family protein [Spirosoma sp. SC4-14]|uniref:GNAT family N-acetyltransferase n=1 Tax=Spirosoma sp. SC4-14 TaxID=3128900 RepID=UPI0030CDF8EB
MDLLPIYQTLTENRQFLGHPDCEPALQMSVDFFNRIGYDPPWNGYFVQLDGSIVGSAAFKGKPKNGRVEIAYGTVARYQNQGIGTQICQKLVELALATDSAVAITARTLPEENYSTRVLKKNGFEWQGMVWDEEDGDVWEWLYVKR